MSAIPGGKPPKKLLSSRHTRGWIVAAILFTAITFTLRSLYLTYHLIDVGDDKRLFLADPSLPWIAVFYVLAIVVGSGRISGFAISMGKLIALRLHLIDPKAPGTPKRPRKIAPPKSEEWIVKPSSDDEDDEESDGTPSE